MYGYIYKTTNLVNNKIYIGQKKANSFLSNKYLGSGTLFLRAVNSYGKDNFICELVEECNSASELNEREIYWINFYNSTDTSIGYNLTLGGEGIRGYSMSDETKEKISNSLKGKFAGENNPMYGSKGGFYGKHHSKETKEKMRLASLGKPKSDLHRKNISISKSGNNHPNFGKELREETKKKMSLKAKLSWEDKTKRDNRLNSHYKRKVLNIDTGESFDSIKSATEKYGGNIGGCCRGIRKTACGYHWKFI